MHIPDGFLSTPVWATLDAAAIPAVGYMGRKAQAGFSEGRIPLLGVMGAFVFAAQIINFPVGIGTSGHLVGGALLAMTLGPAAATIVMTAILTIQALVFQDGGILALGANTINMALLGVWAGYLPFHIWGRGPRRKLAIFLGGFLSVLVSALLALSQLLASGIRMPRVVLGVSITLFLVSAALEGVITLAVIQALERMNRKFVHQPSADRGRAIAMVGLAAGLLVVGGVLVASTHPDGIEKLAQTVGIASHAKTWIQTPLSDYQFRFLESPWLSKATAGMFGLVVIYTVCMLLGRALKTRTAQASTAE